MLDMVDRPKILPKDSEHIGRVRRRRIASHQLVSAAGEIIVLDIDQY